MKIPPGTLRTSAVNNIIGIMHQAHVAGPWACEAVRTTTFGGEVNTEITFRVGLPVEGWDIRTPDPRPAVTINIKESSGQ